MIARRIDRQPHSDSYRALALYIADAQKDGEKVLARWTTGGLADDYMTAIIEAEATQALNTRSAKAKTYHLQGHGHLHSAFRRCGSGYRISNTFQRLG